MKKLTESQVKHIKENLIKFQNQLIRKNRIKKDNEIYDTWYYVSITYNGIKDIRYLFNEKDIYNGINDIKYLLNGTAFIENEDKITHKHIRRGAYYAEKIKKNKIKTTYKESQFKSIIVYIRNKLSKNGDRLIKKGLYYVEELKSLGSAEIKNTKEKLIIFKNELIRKNKSIIGLKKILMITMGILNTKVLKILDIYLIKKIFTMVLMILNICSMELYSTELHSKKMKTK